MVLRRAVVVLVCSGCFSDPGPVGEGGTTESASTGATSSPGGTSSASGPDPSGASSSSEDSTGSSTDASTTETGSTTGASCPTDMQCLVGAPAAWTGPFVVVVGNGGDAEPPCPRAWPERVSTVRDELQAASPSCSCECTPPGSACSASVELYLDDACTSFDIAHPSEGGACTQTASASAVVLASTAANIFPPACSGSVVAGIPAPMWSTTGSVCTWSEVPQSCEDEGSCVPIEGEACILREGEHGCPAGPYGVARTWWSAVMDDRDCSACSCGPPVDAICGGSSRLDLFASGDCSGAASDVIDVDTCGPAATSARYVPESLGECTVEVASVATGTAAPVGPITLCCAE